ncbi:hypothetical protein MLD38_028246 [Melastoma candidum]|uniref:Uncharacterized protein n=1 Tax=Melastoma candidum TaxID=119954 RepID=A0ACB9N6H0_9MYRT|nr:hypothetical protein MLD38_028246 [Melastoma candidum]
MKIAASIHRRVSEGLVLGTASPVMQAITGEIVLVTYKGPSVPGRSVVVQLVSRDEIDPATGNGRLSRKASLEYGDSVKEEGVKVTSYAVNVKVERRFGTPSAFLVANKHQRKFFLQQATFNLPGGKRLHFQCYSWVYPIRETTRDRIFFTNNCYLPNQTPAALLPFRTEELRCLRDERGEQKEWERAYVYDSFHDGTEQRPYPRHILTGHSSDPKAENCPAKVNLDIFVPPDDQMHPRKLLELQARATRALVLYLDHEAEFSQKEDSGSFNSFEEILEVFSAIRGPPKENTLNEARKILPKEYHRAILETRKQKTRKFPLPCILTANRWAWKDDNEFARQMLAGTNPTRVCLLREFPPQSRSGISSLIKKEYIEYNLDGLTTEQAVEQCRMFILDHHDYLIPFLGRDDTRGICAYASRTLLFLRGDSTLKPVAIELTLPGSSSELEISGVFCPRSEGINSAIWQLAKTHVAANDCAYHQLITHWLQTHAVIEPFIIAARRQLSVMHPVHWLLRPHFRDTIHINALYRSIIVNCGGLLEKTLFTGEASTELTSELYKEWRFNEQGLPADLLKRGMAVEDPQEPAGVRLIFEDYPYGKDGLDIWMAIWTWVKEFCWLFYRDDAAVESDKELQAWWSEIRNVGHHYEPEDGWYSMKKLPDLIQALTTIIWITSAHHAAVSSGQYAYASYPPNRPPLCRTYIPEEGSMEFAEFLGDTDGYYLKMLPRKSETILWVALMEVLSRHGSDEPLLGQRPQFELNGNEEIQKLHDKFKTNLREIRIKISKRNKNRELKNRRGPAGIPYNLLYPGTSDEDALSSQGISGKCIPNSISI